MAEATEEVTLDEYVNGAIEDALLEVHTGIVARVVSYDRDAQTVSVTLPISRMVPDGEGNYVAEEMTPISDVPVKWPRCRKFGIVWPLAAGDGGILVCTETSIAEWMAHGNPCCAGDIGRFTIDGAVFEPGLDDNDHRSVMAAIDAQMRIGSEAHGESRIVIANGGGGQLGEGATLGIARNTDPVGVIGGSYTATSLTLNVKDGTSALGTLAITVASGVLVVTPVGVTAPTGTFTLRGSIESASASWACVD